MARKPGPKKKTEQRRRTTTQGRTSDTGNGAKRSAGSSSAAARPEEPVRSDAFTETRKSQATGSRLAGLANAPWVRRVMAATLVSAAGALLFNKRRDKREDEEQSSETSAPARQPVPEPVNSNPPQSRATKGKSGAPRRAKADAGDPLVAAGVAAKGRKKQSAASPKPRRRSGPGAEAAQPVEPGPGAYPDGSPGGDAAGRTSVEGGGGDRPE